MIRLSRLIGASLSVALLASCSNITGFSPMTPLTATESVAASDGYAAGVKVAPDFRDFGHAPPSLQVRLAVTLAYQHQSELEALVEAQSDRDSPYFRHYLTNQEFNARFAPSVEGYRRAIELLRGAGLRVVQTFGNRTIVVAVGSSAAVERLFATRIDYGVQAGHGNRYMNVTDAMMPPALRDIAVVVSGLDDLVSFGPRIQIDEGPQVAPRSQRLLLRGPNGELGPLGFARAYDEPSLHGYNGKGRAIANTYAGDINDNDLHTFLTFFGIRPAHGLRRIKVDGGRFGRPRQSRNDARH